MIWEALFEERRDAGVWFVADGLLLQSRPWSRDALCGNENMKIEIEKIFVIVFFTCLCISAFTFLVYDQVSEEKKKYIIYINILFLIIIIEMINNKKKIKKK